MKSCLYLFTCLFPVLAIAQNMDRMDFAMDELDRETDSCLPKYKQALARNQAYSSEVKQLNKVILQCRKQLEAKPEVVSNNIDPNPQLLSQISQLTTSLTASQRENSRLQASITQLKSQLATALTNKPVAVSKAVPVGSPSVTSQPVSTKAKKLKLYSATSSSHYSSYSAKGLIDGDTKKKNGRPWLTESGQVEEQFVNIVLTKAQTVTRVRMLLPEGDNLNGIDHVVLSFTDGSSQRVQLSREWGWKAFDISPVLTETVKISFYLVSEDIRSRRAFIRVDEVELFGY